MATKVRRAPGTGSYWPLPHGGYRVQVVAGWTPAGNTRYVRRTVRTSGRAGEREAKALLVKLVRETDPAAATSGVTVKEWAAKWLDEITFEKVRPATWTNNKSQVNKWIVPTIGKRRLDKLTPGDVRAVTKAVLSAKLAASTAQRVHSVLIKMLRDAILEGYPVPARLLEMDAPERQEPEREDIPLADALRILNVAKDRPDASRWVAAMLQGIRPAECRGLRWSDIDFDANLMSIGWQLKALPYRVKGDRTSGFRIPAKYKAIHLVDAYHLVRPKTKKGQRVIPIVPWMREALLAWKQASKPNDHDLVWPGKFGRPMNDVDDRDAWKALCAAAKVPAYDLYSCRHTTVSLLTADGVHPLVIQAIVGHASSRSTATYTHIQMPQAVSALTGLADRLKLGGSQAALGAGE